MATKPATPGTGLVGPLYILDTKGEVVATFPAPGLEALVIDDATLATLAAAIKAVVEALGGSATVV